MRRVTATKIKATNKKCEVSCEVKGDLSYPTVKVTFGEVWLSTCNPTVVVGTYWKGAILFCSVYIYTEVKY